MSWLKLARAFLAKDARLFISYRLVLIFNLASIVFGVATYFFMGEAVVGKLGAYGSTYFPYVIIGIVTSNLLLAATSGLATQLSQDLQAGTLEMLFCYPHRPLKLLLAMSSWSFVFALLVSVMQFAVAVCCFDLSIHWRGLPAALLILLASLLTFYALGLLSAILILRFKRGNPIQWLLATSQVLLGGVYFPTETLPSGLNKLANCLPLVHSIEGMRQALLVGSTMDVIARPLVGLCVLGGVLFIVAIIALKKVLYWLRLHGSFVQY